MFIPIATDNLIRSASREVLHLQKAMEQMNLKLDNGLPGLTPNRMHV